MQRRSQNATRALGMLALMLCAANVYSTATELPATGGFTGFGPGNSVRGETFVLPTAGLPQDITVFFEPTPDSGVDFQIQIAKFNANTVGDILFTSQTFTVPFGAGRELLPFTADLNKLPLAQGRTYAWLTRYVGNSDFKSAISGTHRNSDYPGEAVGVVAQDLDFAFTLNYAPIPEPAIPAALCIGYVALMLNRWHNRMRNG